MRKMKQTQKRKFGVGYLQTLFVEVAGHLYVLDPLTLAKLT